MHKRSYHARYCPCRRPSHPPSLRVSDKKDGLGRVLMKCRFCGYLVGWFQRDGEVE